MIRTAQVISCAVDDGAAMVQLDGVDSCQRCSRGEGCGAQLALLNNAAPCFKVHCNTGLTVVPGQSVSVEIDEQGSGWLWFVFGAYGLPLAGMLLFTAAGSVFLHSSSAYATSASLLMSELIIVAMALIGLAAGVMVWRRVAARVLAGVEHSLCLSSARIVAIHSVAGSKT